MTTGIIPKAHPRRAQRSTLLFFPEAMRAPAIVAARTPRSQPTANADVVSASLRSSRRGQRNVILRAEEAHPETANGDCTFGELARTVSRLAMAHRRVSDT
jgi:hypothetical protein